MDGEMTIAQMSQDPEIRDVVSAIQSSLDAVPGSTDESYDRVATIYRYIATKRGSHKLLRGSRKLARCIGDKGDALIKDIIAAKQTNPDMACKCDATMEVINATLRRYHGLFKQRYNFRPCIKKPVRYITIS